MSATLAKRAAPEPEVSPVDAAAVIVADLSERLNAAHLVAEHIRAARAPLAFDASRGNVDAVARLGGLTRASAENA